MGGDVVPDPAQVIFIISKNPYSTKPMVILNFSTTSLFLLWPTVCTVGFSRNRDSVAPVHKNLSYVEFTIYIRNILLIYVKVRYVC